MAATYIDDPIWLCEHPETHYRHPNLRLHLDCDDCQRCIAILLRSGLIKENVGILSTADDERVPVTDWLAGRKEES